MPAAKDATHGHIKDVNTRYHDVAAESYDSKWGIDFGDIGRSQVGAKFGKAVGDRKIVERSGPLQGAPFDRGLEIGAGTGYFSLNLAQMGVIGSVTATDISPGMLEALSKSAAALSIAVETAVCEAEELPFADESFDIVFGHAILHHIPDLDRAMREFLRVLRPGGVIAFCGEPSRHGDRLAVVPKRTASAVAPIWRAALRAEPRSDSHDRSVHGNWPEHGAHHSDHDLESEVDVHAFSPSDLADFAERCGFDSVRVSGEELLSNMYGWALRTVESSAEPDTVPMGWRMFAYRSFIALQKLDAFALEPYLPAKLFYNLLISAEKPD